MEAGLYVRQLLLRGMNASRGVATLREINGVDRAAMRPRGDTIEEKLLAKAERGMGNRLGERGSTILMKALGL
jgi:hypothetical protein